ncbi:MAG: hypothetical protein V4738_09355 [Pseudomonadota bacterium]
MKKAALIIGLVSAQAFAIGAFAQTTKTDPLSLPNSPHLNVAPADAQRTPEDTPKPGKSNAAATSATKADKQMAKQERVAARKNRIAEQNAAPPAGSAASPSGVKSPDSGPK